MYKSENPIGESDIILKKLNDYRYRILSCESKTSKSNLAMLAINGEIIDHAPIEVHFKDANGNDASVQVDINGLEIPYWLMLDGKTEASDRVVKYNAKCMSQTYDFPNPYDEGFDPNMLVGKVLNVTAETKTEANKDGDGKVMVNPHTGKPSYFNRHQISQVWHKGSK